MYLYSCAITTVFLLIFHFLLDVFTSVVGRCLLCLTFFWCMIQRCLNWYMRLLLRIEIIRLQQYQRNEMQDIQNTKKTFMYRESWKLSFYDEKLLLQSRPGHRASIFRKSISKHISNFEKKIVCVILEIWTRNCLIIKLWQFYELKILSQSPDIRPIARACQKTKYIHFFLKIEGLVFEILLKNLNKNSNFSVFQKHFWQKRPL